MGGQPVALGAAKQRAVLAMLALRRRTRGLGGPPDRGAVGRASRRRPRPRWSSSTSRSCAGCSRRRRRRGDRHARARLRAAGRRPTTSTSCASSACVGAGRRARGARAVARTRRSPTSPTSRSRRPRSGGSRSCGSRALERGDRRRILRRAGTRELVGRARGAGRRAPAARAPPRPADARAVSLRAGKPTRWRRTARRARALVDELGHRAGPGAAAARARRSCDAGRRASRRRRRRRTCRPRRRSTLGRERELRAASELLERDGTRLLTLTGPGGRRARRGWRSSSPRRAGEVRRRRALRARSRRWRAPIRSPGRRRAGARASPACPARDARGRARAPPAREQLLLVLDNFEHVLDAGAGRSRELLARAAACGCSSTSRQPLRLLRRARRSPSPPLAEGADAVALFAARAARQRARRDRRSGRRGCHGRDLPRGSTGCRSRSSWRRRATALLPPRGAAARGSTSGSTLLAGGARDLPARQRTLRATIDWSHDLLAAAEQALLAAARRCSRAAARSARRLRGLLDRRARSSGSPRSSTTACSGGRPSADGEPRFSMLETIREYAAERLAGDPEREAVRRRHAEYFAAYAEQTQPEVAPDHTGAPLPRFELEHDNLRAAIAWSRAAGRTDLELRLAGSLGWFWHAAWPSSRGRGDARRRAREHEPRRPRAHTTPARAGLPVPVSGRDVDRAAADAEELLELTEHVDDPEVRSETLLRLGLVAHERGDHAAATATLRGGRPPVPPQRRRADARHRARQPRRHRAARRPLQAVRRAVDRVGRARSRVGLRATAPR